MQCPTCGNMTNYVEEYGQYYCYTCQAYIEAAQQPFPQQYDQQPQPYQSTYQQQPAAPQTQYQAPYEQTPQPGHGQVPQGFQPAEGTIGMPYQTQYSGYTPGAQQPLGAAPATAPGIQPGYADPYGRGVPTPEKKKGSKGKIILAVVLGIVLIIAMIGFYIIYALDEAEVTWGSSSGDEISLGYSRAAFGGDFYVTFLMTDGADLDDLSFQILDNSSQVVEMVDPDDETLDMEGDIADIIFSQEEYDVANTTYDDEYYSRVPSNGTNHTLYITFVDVDDDGMFSTDDKMYIRGLANGGSAESTHVLRLRNKPKGKYYQEIALGSTW